MPDFVRGFVNKISYFALTNTVYFKKTMGEGALPTYHDNYVLRKKMNLQNLYLITKI